MNSLVLSAFMGENNESLIRQGENRIKQNIKYIINIILPQLKVKLQILTAADSFLRLNVTAGEMS